MDWKREEKRKVNHNKDCSEESNRLGCGEKVERAGMLLSIISGC